MVKKDTSLKDKTIENPSLTLHKRGKWITNLFASENTRETLIKAVSTDGLKTAAAKFSEEDVQIALAAIRKGVAKYIAKVELPLNKKSIEMMNAYYASLKDKP